MWRTNTINGYEYYAKVYDESSINGINEGRISKLTVSKNGEEIASYDRGWDVEPAAEHRKAVEEIINIYK